MNADCGKGNKMPMATGKVINSPIKGSGKGLGGKK